MESSVYSLLLFLTALCAAILSFYTWRRRRVAGAYSLIAFMGAVALWSVGYAFEILAADVPTKILWAKVQYMGIVAIPLAWLDFALRYSGRGGWPIRHGATIFAVIPLITLALVWTNEFHGLIWATIETTDSGALGLDYGPLFWVYFVYSYLLLLAGALILGRVALRSANLYRKQSALLLCGVIAPWVGNSLYVLDLLPFDLDLTPVGFLASGAVFLLALFRFRLFDLGPVARDAVIEGMEDGVIVVDAEGRIVDVNPAASRILGLLESKAVGTDASGNVPGWNESGRSEVSLGEGEARRDFEVSVSSLSGKRGNLAGSVVVLRDVTVRRRASFASGPSFGTRPSSSSDSTRRVGSRSPRGKDSKPSGWSRARSSGSRSSKCTGTCRRS